jgi:phosphoinositide-3-kinase regulatory subunit 4
VDYVADSVPLPQYGKNRLIRQIDTEKDSIQAMDQFSAELSSPLIFVTDKNAVYGHDLRLKNTAWVLQVPPKYGVVTAMAVDKINHAWITLGTHKGILTVLDIRFQIPLKSWLHPSQSPIQRLTQIPHHERPQGDSVMCAAGRNELTVWDLQRSLCTEVLCARNLTERVNRYARTFTVDSNLYNNDG